MAAGSNITEIGGGVTGAAVKLTQGRDLNKTNCKLPVLYWRKYYGLCFLFGATSSSVGVIGKLPSDCAPQGGRLTFSIGEHTSRGHRVVRGDIDKDGNIYQVASKAERADLNAWVYWSGVVFSPQRGTPLELNKHREKENASRFLQTNLKKKRHGHKIKWRNAGRDTHPAEITKVVAGNHTLCVTAGKIKGGHWGILARIPEVCHFPGSLAHRFSAATNQPDQETFRHTSSIHVDISRSKKKHHGHHRFYIRTHKHGFLKKDKSRRWVSLAGKAWLTREGESVPVQSTWRRRKNFQGLSASLFGGRLVMLSGVLRARHKDPSHEIGTLPKKYWPPKGVKHIFSTSRGNWLTQIEVDDTGSLKFVGSSRSLRKHKQKSGREWINLSGIMYFTAFSGNATAAANATASSPPPSAPASPPPPALNTPPPPVSNSPAPLSLNPPATPPAAPPQHAITPVV